MPPKLHIIRTIEPQLIRVWADRVTTAPLHFGIDPARLQWHREAPSSRQAMKAENQKIKEIAEQATLAAWQQPRPLPVIELAADKNHYLLIGNREDYRVLKGIQNARHRAVLVSCYTISKHDIAFIDFDSLTAEAA